MDFGDPFLMGKSGDGTPYYKIFAGEQAARLGSAVSARWNGLLPGKLGRDWYYSSTLLRVIRLRIDSCDFVDRSVYDVARPSGSWKSRARCACHVKGETRARLDPHRHALL